MPPLKKWERALGRFAVPNLALLLVMGQVGVFLLTLLGKVDPGWFVFVPLRVAAGEWWRFATFLFLPPPTSWLFVVFVWWMFYLMGSALEAHWGALRFNLFLLIGAALTLGLSFLSPLVPVTNEFLGGSVFLAFAYLNPDFELLLFFILPVKIRWLALLAWIVYAYQFITGGAPERLAIVAAVGNFFLFFGRDLVLTLRSRRRSQARASQAAAPAPFRHRCRICGRTDRTNPELDFRYCSQCSGDECYCPDHIRNHTHVTLPPGGG